MFNKKELLIYNKDIIPYIKFKMIPDSFGEAGMYFVGCGVYGCGCNLTELETYKINITKDDFINNNCGIIFQYPGYENTYSENNCEARFSVDNITSDQTLIQYESNSILIPIALNYVEGTLRTNNISYHPFYKYCEKWRSYANTDTETDWITVSFLNNGINYINFKLSFTGLGVQDNLKFYTTDSLSNIYSEDLSDTSKFEFLGDMEILPNDLNAWLFNPISVYIPKDKILIAQVNNIFYTNSVSGCSYDQVSVYGSHKRIAFYNFTDIEPSATVYTSTGYSEQ